MERIIEVTEEIEKKGVRILKDADRKYEEILEITRQKIAKLEHEEISKANVEANELYLESKKDIENEIKNLLKGKEAKIKSILAADTSKINIKELIIQDILGLQ